MLPSQTTLLIARGKIKQTTEAIRNVSNISISIEALGCTVTLQHTVQANFTKAGRKQNTKRKQETGKETRCSTRKP